MKDKNQFCSNCHFFHRTGSRAAPEEEASIGFCRANPPIPHFHPTGKPAIGLFPTVLGSMWCGVYDYTYEREEQGGPSGPQGETKG